MRLRNMVDFAEKHIQNGNYSEVERLAQEVLRNYQSVYKQIPSLELSAKTYLAMAYCRQGKEHDTIEKLVFDISQLQGRVYSATDFKAGMPKLILLMSNDFSFPNTIALFF